MPVTCIQACDYSGISSLFYFLFIRWTDFVTNVKVLEQTEIHSIESMRYKYQLLLAGHVSRIEDNRLPRIALYGELSTGKKNRGAPNKLYKACLKKSLIACHFAGQTWQPTVMSDVIRSSMLLTS